MFYFVSCKGLMSQTQGFILGPVGPIHQGPFIWAQDQCLYRIFFIHFASPSGPEKSIWSPGTLDEFRKWHAQMCLRLGPQGRENSVAFDVHCIILEVCFVALGLPGGMNNLV